MKAPTKPSPAWRERVASGASRVRVNAAAVQFGGAGAPTLTLPSQARRAPPSPARRARGSQPELERGQNGLQHTFGVRQDFVVPETQYAPAVIFEPAGPVGITCALGMLTTIRLDDQSMVEADEIDDEGSDWMLSSELEPRQLPAAQRRPEPTLGIGGSSPESSRELVLHGPQPIKCSASHATPAEHRDDTTRQQQKPSPAWRERVRHGVTRVRVGAAAAQKGSGTPGALTLTRLAHARHPLPPSGRGFTK